LDSEVDSLPAVGDFECVKGYIEVAEHR